MIKEKVLRNVVVCDICESLIGEARPDHNDTKFQSLNACILCGKDLCSDCGGNPWGYRAYRFLLCPGHNPTMKELAAAISEKLP